MFGKKKKTGQTITFVNGQRIDQNTIQKKNPETASALEPEQVPVQEPPQSQGEGQPIQVVVDCLVCSQNPRSGLIDYGFYVDSSGVWHPCPRCNPSGAISPTRKEETSSKPKKKR